MLPIFWHEFCISRYEMKQEHLLLMTVISNSLRLANARKEGLQGE